jgi:small-conductance mechanosensitive channel
MGVALSNIVNASNKTSLSVSEVNTAISFVNPLIIKIIMALVILLLGFVVGKLIEKLFLKLFDLIDLNKHIGKLIKLKFSLSKVIARIIAYFIYIIGIIMALNTLGITTAIIGVIVAIFIVILLLLVIFGANDLFANFFSGLLIRIRINIKKGDHLKIKDKDKKIEGHVLSVNLLNIRIETGHDEQVFIPNMALFKSNITKLDKNQ